MLTSVITGELVVRCSGTVLLFILRKEKFVARWDGLTSNRRDSDRRLSTISLLAFARRSLRFPPLPGGILTSFLELLPLLCSVNKSNGVRNRTKVLSRQLMSFHLKNRKPSVPGTSESRSGYIQNVCASREGSRWQTNYVDCWGMLTQNRRKNGGVVTLTQGGTGMKDARVLTL